MKKYRNCQAAKRLSALIEEERRKIGGLTFDNLSSPEVIERMGKLERLINEYTILVYLDKCPPTFALLF